MPYFVGEYTVSTDRSRIDLRAVHAFLSQSYWSPGVPEAVVRRAIAGAICFGIYHGSEQVGFARVITDQATYAYLSDVYVLDEHQGNGLGTAMVRLIVEHPSVDGVRLQLLGTADAQWLYARVGYVPIADPERWMVRRRADSVPREPCDDRRRLGVLQGVRPASVDRLRVARR